MRSTPVALTLLLLVGLCLTAGCPRPEATAPAKTGPLAGEKPKPPPPTGAETSQPTKSAPGEIAWINSYLDGMDQAKSQGKPVMIDLYADWCGPCRQLDEETWRDPAIVQLAAKFVCIKVNVDEDQETARKFGANAIPLVVFLSSDGTEIDRHVGFIPAAQMKPLMEKAAGG